MKVISYPETRQVFNYDCGSNALLSLLAYAGIEEREDRIMKLAGTTSDGTDPAGVLLVLGYFGLPNKAGEGMTPNQLRRAIDAGHPTMLCLQAYRESDKPYSELWDDGHWVVCIGYDTDRILFEDPASFHRTWLGDKELVERWHDVDGKKRIIGYGVTVEVSSVYNHDFVEHMN